VHQITALRMAAGVGRMGAVRLLRLLLLLAHCATGCVVVTVVVC
jgi:hypothetical protein